MTTPTPPSNAIRVLSYEGYTIHLKDDGFDYLSLFAQLDTIKESAQMFDIWNKRHQVFKFEYEGRTFVAKIDPDSPKYLENKLWEILTGSFYSTQMKAVNKAIKAGCTVVPDIYLVAEKKEKLVRRESIIIMEYVPGSSLCVYQEDTEPYREMILSAMSELHKHGLALGDANCGNFIINDGTCKILDLSWHGMARIGQAKDRVILERVYGWEMPGLTLSDKLAEGYIRAKRAIQHSLSPRKRNRPNR